MCIQVGTKYFLQVGKNLFVIIISKREISVNSEWLQIIWSKLQSPVAEKESLSTYDVRICLKFLNTAFSYLLDVWIFIYGCSQLI